MSLDPLSGLDPLLPAKTLTKTIRYTYVQPVVSPVVTASSGSSTTYVSTPSTATVQAVYYVIDPTTGLTKAITYAQWVTMTRTF